MGLEAATKALLDSGEFMNESLESRMLTIALQVLHMTLSRLHSLVIAMVILLVVRYVGQSHLNAQFL